MTDDLKKELLKAAEIGLRYMETIPGIKEKGSGYYTVKAAIAKAKGDIPHTQMVVRGKRVMFTQKDIELISNSLDALSGAERNDDLLIRANYAIKQLLNENINLKKELKTMNKRTIIGLAHTILNEGGHVTKNENDLAKVLVLIEQNLKTGATGEYLTNSIWHALNAEPYSPEKKDTSHIMQSFNPD